MLIRTIMDIRIHSILKNSRRFKNPGRQDTLNSNSPEKHMTTGIHTGGEVACHTEAGAEGVMNIEEAGVGCRLETRGKGGSSILRRGGFTIEMTMTFNQDMRGEGSEEGHSGHM